MAHLRFWASSSCYLLSQAVRVVVLWASDVARCALRTWVVDMLRVIGDVPASRRYRRRGRCAWHDGASARLHGPCGGQMGFEHVGGVRGRAGDDVCRNTRTHYCGPSRGVDRRMLSRCAAPASHIGADELDARSERIWDVVRVRGWAGWALARWLGCCGGVERTVHSITRHIETKHGTFPLMYRLWHQRRHLQFWNVPRVGKAWFRKGIRVRATPSSSSTTNGWILLFSAKILATISDPVRVKIEAPPPGHSLVQSGATNNQIASMKAKSGTTLESDTMWQDDGTSRVRIRKLRPTQKVSVERMEYCEGPACIYPIHCIRTGIVVDLSDEKYHLRNPVSNELYTLNVIIINAVMGISPPGHKKMPRENKLFVPKQWCSHEYLPITMAGGRCRHQAGTARPGHIIWNVPGLQECAFHVAECTVHGMYLPSEFRYR
ncbi:hypothetical protein C8J57DRAFT_1254971 [Mycena rebaudengoi]|nr:hypothetical protein C8J57DRAFT_1254971 [Mycena rebaudengoi]